jgi:DNA polymerase I-like protein with 3'-5' exonuclease and polymerase domains
VIGDIDNRIRKMLNAPGLAVHKGKALGAALIKAKKLTTVTMTAPSKTHPNGQISTAKDALLEGIGDERLLALLLYRGALATCVQTFMRVWLRQAEETGGTIHTSWNQVRQSDVDGDLIGARTGRLSSSPNFQNIPTSSSPNYERLIAC